MGNLGMVILPFGVAGENDVPAALEHCRQAVERLAPHDHRAAHGELFEAAKVGREVPGHFAISADHAIGGPGEDQRNLGMVHKGPSGAVPTQVTWPSLRPSRTSVLP